MVVCCSASSCLYSLPAKEILLWMQPDKLAGLKRGCKVHSEFLSHQRSAQSSIRGLPLRSIPPQLDDPEEGSPSNAARTREKPEQEKLDGTTCRWGRTNVVLTDGPPPWSPSTPKTPRGEKTPELLSPRHSEDYTYTPPAKELPAARSCLQFRRHCPAHVTLSKWQPLLHSPRVMPAARLNSFTSQAPMGHEDWVISQLCAGPREPEVVRRGPSARALAHQDWEQHKSLAVDAQVSHWKASFSAKPADVPGPPAAHSPVGASGLPRLLGAKDPDAKVHERKAHEFTPAD